MKGKVFMVLAIFLMVIGLVSATEVKIDTQAGADHHTFYGSGDIDFDVSFQGTNSGASMAIDQAESVSESPTIFEATWRKNVGQSGGLEGYAVSNIYTRGSEGASMNDQATSGTWDSYGLMKTQSGEITAKGNYLVQSVSANFESEWHYNNGYSDDLNVVEVQGSGSASLDEGAYWSNHVSSTQASDDQGIDYSATVSADGQGNYYRTATGKNYLDTEVGTAENGGSFEVNGNFNNGFESDVSTNSY